MTAAIRTVMYRDIRNFFSEFYGVGFRTTTVILDTVVFAFIITKIVPTTLIGGLTYLQFFALGALVTSVFWAAYTIGREVYWDRESNYLNYLMSLPISRADIVAGRSLGGSLRAVMTVIPLYVLVAVLVPSSFATILASVAILFVFSFGLCGLGLIVSLSVRQETKSRLLNTSLSLVLIRSSTAVYPLVVMPVWLQYATGLNPVTYASNAIRSVMSSKLSLNEVAIVFLFSTIVALFGSWIFSHRIEGGPAE